MRRAQIAVEYLFIMGIATLLLIGFLVVVANVQNQARASAIQSEVDRIASAIQGEVILATRVRDGYVRTFTLPDDIHGKPYVIRNEPGRVLVSAGDASSSRLAPSYVGTPVPGSNTVTRQAGVIRFI